MHPDLTHLLLYAKQYPDDETARLVIADWLEEHGDEDERARAKFIRLQSGFEQEQVDSARWRELRADVAVLRLNHLHRWLGQLAGLPGLNDVEFERGLFRLKLGPEITRFLASLPEMPEWAWVDGLLCAWPPWAARELGRLVASPSLAGIRHLSLQGADPWPSHLLQLATNPAAANLLTLDLTECHRFDRPAARALLASPYLRGLRRLILIDVGLDVETERVLRERFGDGLCVPR